MLSRKKLWIFVRDAFIIPIVTCAIFFPILGPIAFIMELTYVPVLSEITVFFGGNPHPTVFDAFLVATVGYFLLVLVIIIPFTFMWALFTPREN